MARPHTDPWWLEAPVAEICKPPRVGRTVKHEAQPPRAVCRVPGCENQLHRDNKGGVCKDHLHAMGYCRCVYCEGAG